MRKGASRLAYVVERDMHLNPFSKSIFVFCGKNKRTLKAIFWHQNGYVEIIKRLECGMSFKWPDRIEDQISITFNDIIGILKGQDMMRKFPSFTPSKVG